MVVHPGPQFSTHDVWVGLCAGLIANGVEVEPYPLHNALTVNQSIYNVAAEYAPLTAQHFNPYAVVAQALVGMCIWKECDAMIAVTGDRLHFAAIHTLRKAGITTALLCTESPYLTESREQYDAHHYDVVFTNERNAVPLLHHPNAHYLPHAYNPELHYAGAAEGNKQVDTFFVGTAFEERKALFGGVDWTGINHIERGTLWRGNSDTETMLADLTDNSEAAAWYRSARININHHRTTGVYGNGQHIAPGAAQSLGPRAYEIAACAGFQLMDDSRPEALDIFGESLVTYRAGDSADLEKQIRFWLAHDAYRAEWAAAQHAAIQPHTWAARAAQLLNTLDGQRHLALRTPLSLPKEHPTWQPDMV